MGVAGSRSFAAMSRGKNARDQVMRQRPVVFQDFVVFDQRPQRGVPAKRAHVAIVVENSHRRQFVGHDMEVMPDGQPQPHVEVGKIGESRIEKANVVICGAPRHDGRVTQAVAVEKEKPQPIFARSQRMNERRVEYLARKRCAGRERLASLVDKARHPEDRRNVRMIAQETHLLFQLARQEKVIRCQHADELAARAANGGVQRDHRAAVLIECFEANPRIGKPADHVGRAVARSIVRDDDLEVGKRLIQNALNRFANKRRMIERRNDD